MTIFVGNLNRNVREEELGNLFLQFGEVRQVKIIKDTYSGESKGYAFIEMYEQNHAKDAIKNLNEKEFAGRKLSVSEARPKTEGNRNRNNNYAGSNSSGYKKRYNY